MKKIVAILVLAFIFLQNPYEVKAANICTKTIYNELKRDAYQVSFGWELKFDEKNNYYFEVTVSNMNSNVLLVFGGITYEANDTGIFKLNSPLEGGKNYEFNFYGGYDSPCVEEYVYTTYLQLPKYNKYSELDECIEYEEFALCNKWYKGEIESNEYFYQKLEEYKKSLEKPEEKPPVEKEKNVFERILEFYLENIVFTLPITILFVLLVVILIIVKIRRSRKRVKIDI